MKSNAIQFLTYGAILSSVLLLPNLAKEYGATDFEIGLIGVAYGLATFASFYTFGRASDIYGRRIFVWLGLAFSSITFLLQYFAYELVSLFILRTIAGFCSGIFPAALIAYVYESKRKLGKFTSFGSLGWGAGTLVAGALAFIFNEIKVTFLLSSLFFAVAFLISLKLPKVKGARLKIPFFPKEVIKRNKSIYIGMLIRHSGAMSIWAFWPLFLMELNADFFWIGVIMATNTITQFLIMFFITDRFESTLIFPVGLALSAVTFFTFIIAPNFWYILAFQVFLGTSWSFTYVGALKFVTERNVEKATASGMLHSTMSLSGIIGPLLGGIVVGVTGTYYSPIYLALFMALIAFGISGSMIRKDNKF